LHARPVNKRIFPFGDTHKRTVSVCAHTVLENNTMNAAAATSRDRMWPSKWGDGMPRCGAIFGQGENALISEEIRDFRFTAYVPV
jgi:hypothetical protein